MKKLIISLGFCSAALVAQGALPENYDGQYYVPGKMRPATDEYLSDISGRQSFLLDDLRLIFGDENGTVSEDYLQDVLEVIADRVKSFGFIDFELSIISRGNSGRSTVITLISETGSIDVVVPAKIYDISLINVRAANDANSMGNFFWEGVVAALNLQIRSI